MNLSATVIGVIGGVFMVMAESEGGDDQKDVNSGPKSPWKTPVVADAPVMGAESWPALADAHHQQRSKSTDSATKPASVPSPTQVLFF